jgi:hypothetical protein
MGRALAVAIAFWLAGCGGSALPASDSDNAGGEGGEGGPSPGPSIDDRTCTSAGAPESPLRRLTAFEYANTVKDLLGLTTPPVFTLPADEVTDGFDNNAEILRVTTLHAETYLDASEALAAAAVMDLARLAPCDAGRSDDACARGFIASFGRRAFRRPLTSDEQERAFGLFTAGKTLEGYRTGIELVVRGMLQSPSFVYRLELGVAPQTGQEMVPLSQYEIATRLSYFLWATAPDLPLLDQADAGKLGTRAEVRDQAREMLDDPRARPVVRSFHQQWLGIAGIAQVTKDPAAYPDFGEDVRAAMQGQAAAFTEHVVWQGDARLDTLLASPLTLVNAPLRAIHDVPGSQALSAEFTPVTVRGPRAGVLTLPAVLSTHALPNQSSPVHRGVFVRERLLCQTPPAVPANVDVTAPEPDPKASTRERFAQHREDAACAACHRLMDPIGLGFEHFDGIGRYRTSDGGKPVDARGEIVSSDDADGAFDGVVELGTRLAGSAQVNACVATQWFRYALGRHEGTADRCGLENLASTLQKGDLRDLLVDITQTDAFLFRRPHAEEVQP